MHPIAIAAGASLLQLALAKPFIARHAAVERRNPQVYGPPPAYEPSQIFSSYTMSGGSSSSSSIPSSSSSVFGSTAPRGPYSTTSTSTYSSPSLSTTVSPFTPTSASDLSISTLTVVIPTPPIVCNCPGSTTTVTLISYLPCPTPPPYSTNSSSAMVYPTSIISSSIDSRIPYPLPTTNISAVFPTSSGGPPYSYSYPTGNSSTAFPTSPLIPIVASRTPFPFPTSNSSIAFPTSPVSTPTVPSYPYPTLNSTTVFPTNSVTSSIESRLPYPLPTTNTSCTYPTSPIISSIESRTPYPLPSTNSSSAFPANPMTSSTLQPYPYPSLSANTTISPSTISSAIESRTPFPMSNSSHVPSGTAVSSKSSPDITLTIQTTVTSRITRTLPLPTTSVSPVFNNSASSSVVSSTTGPRTGGYSDSSPSSSTFVVSISTVTDRFPTSYGMSTMQSSATAATTMVTSSSMQTPGPSSYPSYPTGIPSSQPPPTNEPSSGESWLEKRVKHLIAWLRKHLGQLEAQE